MLFLIRSSHVCVALAEYSGSCSNVFIERIFVFFMTLFLKKMEIIISASNPHCHSRLSKPILKILSIYRKNILGKQLSQAICSKYVFQIISCTKISSIFYNIKYDGQSYQTVHKCSLKKLLWWILWGSLLLNKVSRLQAKERLLHRCFPVSFTKYFRTLLLQDASGVTASAKHPFLFVTLTSATKKISLDLGYSKYFRNKHHELLANSSLWRS